MIKLSTESDSPEILSEIIHITNLVDIPEEPEIWPDNKPSVINNWIKTTVFTDQNAQTSIQNIAYFDGMRRPIQNIQIQASAGANRKNIVLPIAYDSQGRDNAKIYLPYVSSNISASMDSGQFEAQKSYYTSKFSAGEAAYAYTENVFDPSPLNKVRKTFNVGSAYRTQNKSVEYAYNTNSANEVFLLAVNPSDLKLTVLRYYDAGRLYKNIKTNEDGQKVIIYTDANENLILERVVVSPTQNCDTYFAYDDFEQLCWIISPEGSSLLSLGQTISVSDATIAEKYCFIYKYGGLGRLLEKKLPGKGWEYMVYDKGGRLVMYQDAVMRGDNRWLCSVYDNLNRIITQKISITSATRATIQGSYDNTNNYSSLTGTFSLTQTCYAVDESLSKSGSNAYYTGGTAVSSSVFTNLAFQPVAGIINNSLVDNRLNGLLLYEKMYIVDSDLFTANPKYIERVYYYDAQGRTVQTVEKNHLGGISRNSFKYDFIGNVLSRHESHQKASGAAVDAVERQYVYDHRSRLLSETTRLNGGDPATVAYSYDDLGLLTGKTYGTGSGAKTESYAYNIQGWLMSQNSDLFEMNLRYFDTQFGTAKSYSGNIAEWAWKHKGTGTTGQADAYAFTYDNLGRLTDFRQYVNGTLNNKYTEQGITYDLNGNIKSLVRTAGEVTVDDLVYDYTGNRLTALNEAVRTVPSNDVYAPGNAAVGTYTYDANGNMISDSRKGLAFTYNFLNLLSEVRSGSTVKAKYSWLANGTKLQIRDGESNGFYYLGSLTYTGSGSGLTLETVNFSNGVIRAGTNPEINYFLTDYLGSVRVIVDKNGNVKERNDYYAFGAKHVRNDYPQNSNRYDYNGKEEQTTGDLGFLDYGARMYDAALGRWHSIDPLAELAPSVSLYAYCYNNPINFIDRFGLLGEEPTAFGQYRMDALTVPVKSLLKSLQEDFSVFLNALNDAAKQKTEEFSDGKDNSNHEAEMRAYAKAMEESLKRLQREYDMMNKTLNASAGILTSGFSAAELSGKYSIYFSNRGAGSFKLIDYAKRGKIGGIALFGVNVITNIYRSKAGQITKGEAGFNISMGGVGVINPAFAIPYGLTEAFYPGGFGQGLKDVGQFKIERWESMPDWLKGHTLDVKTYY